MTPNKASRTGNACVGSRLFAMAVLSMAALAVAACPGTPPITLIERVIEARSTGDIIEDNRIVLEVNGAIAEIGSIKASTEIYEQRLLIIGLFANRSDYDELRKRVRAIKMAVAIFTGSRAPATALFISTPSQPSSMAMAASEAVPTPASTITGTETVWRRICRL